MSKLTDFLLERIAEDEAVARAWQNNGSWNLGSTGPDTDYEWWFHPTRILAKCEAKRRIVALHPEMLGWCQGCADETYPCRTLRELARPYTDHPDFRKEWLVWN